jgi:hypothetical protein
MKTRILQKNNDDTPQSISNSHDKIFEKVMINNWPKLRADITVRYNKEDFSRKIFEVRNTRILRIAPIAPMKNIGIP